MDIQSIIGGLKEKFGDSFDVTKVTAMLKDVDLSKISMPEIMEKAERQSRLHVWQVTAEPAFRLHGD